MSSEEIRDIFDLTKKPVIIGSSHGSLVVRQQVYVHFARQPRTVCTVTELLNHTASTGWNYDDIVPLNRVELKTESRNVCLLNLNLVALVYSWNKSVQREVFRDSLIGIKWQLIRKRDALRIRISIICFFNGIFIERNPICFQVNASGVFELRLKSFVNEYGKDSLGKCCSGSTSKTGECSGVCKTRFRVCLKQYQVKIDTTTPCTYGDVVTPVLGENIVNLSPNVAMPSFTNPIRFPFEFTWPVSVNLSKY